MTLQKFRSFFVNPFPSSVETVGFGLDSKSFKIPRAHFAHDLALPWPRNQTPEKFPVVAPMNVYQAKFYPIPASGPTKGLSVMDLSNSDDSLRWRFMHILKDEIALNAWAAIQSGRKLRQGAAIGPAGDAGLSLAAPEGQTPPPGSSARHLHAALLLRPGCYDDVLEEAFGERWMIDESASWGIDDALKRNGWTLGNRWAAQRLDPFTHEVFFAVNWRKLLFG